MLLSRCGKHRSVAEVPNKVKTVNGIYRATGGDGRAVTDNSLRRP